MKNRVITNTVITNTNNDTTDSKGVKTMKKSGVLKKIIAGILSAITASRPAEAVTTTGTAATAIIGRQ